MITLTINGKKIKAQAGKTILEVARDNDIHIPTLCYSDALEPAGNCRLCTVQITCGSRTTLETSCNYPIQEGMQVETGFGGQRHNHDTGIPLRLAAGIQALHLNTALGLRCIGRLVVDHETVLQQNDVG